ncbi:oxidoreductase [Actinorhabdospora filicis]|uniref:Probable oxidoreductase n=1 Tax=Actinorhabdospora filicis TaxID=1785913 RepID=A0A9W6W319_9ACTN|nr:SDR family NAD(P)-dependent oxidoreductase [Actinorhabdospora filicis]GLZ77632.1 oxidoreductase [Actinorhabdospora filicis]
MTQKRIDSGFGYRTTADDVLSGIDLSGKYAIVTGGYSGLGLETVKALTKAGAEVLVPARRPEAAAEALAGLAEVDTLDLGDLDSVRAFAGRHLDRPVDILINNAGIMASPETRVGPGWEAQFATNHLGHYTLTNMLWPVLADGGARVVAVSSAGHRLSGIRWDDIQFTTGYDRWLAYGQAKTANILFAVELDRRGRDEGVRAFSLHPGPIMTNLQRHMTREELDERGWVDESGRAVPDFKTPEQGAATQTWAATSPRLDGLGGLYLEDCDVSENGHDYALDPEQARRLWTLSAELTGVG